MRTVQCMMLALAACAAVPLAAGVQSELELATSRLRAGGAADRNRRLSALTRSDIICTDANHIGKFQVRALSASGLADMDTGSDTSDPYVVARWGGNPMDMEDVITDDESPSWPTTAFAAFCVSTGTADDSITLTVYDRDFAAEDDELGSASVVLSSLVNVDGSLTRGSRTLTLNGGGGTLVVEVRFFPTVDVSDAVLSAFPSGSIVLFRSMTFGGFFIRAGTGSMWSHIGFLGHDGNNATHIVESSSNLVQLPDCFDGSTGDGVEALGGRDKIQSGLYNAVAVRPLIAPNAAAQVAWNASMWSTYFAYQDVPYEFETTEMLLGTFNWNDNPDRTSQFCSEFTAEGMQRAGLLGTTQLSNNMVPAEFSSDRQLDLEGGWTWGEEVFLRGILAAPDGLCYEDPTQCQCGEQVLAAGPLLEEQNDKLETVLDAVLYGSIAGAVLILACIAFCVYRCRSGKEEGKTAPDQAPVKDEAAIDDSAAP